MTGYRKAGSLSIIVLLLTAVVACIGVAQLTPLVGVQAAWQAEGRDSRPSNRLLCRLDMRASVTIAAAQNLQVNLGNGRDLLATGEAATGIEAALRQRRAEPLAMAAADFDGDGAAELVTAYGTEAAGALTVRGGNLDTVYPHTAAAVERQAQGALAASPFFAAERIVELPERPDFLVTGDFDGDGHQDIAVAGRDARSLYLLRGDGSGDFAAPEGVELPGAVTAFAGDDTHHGATSTSLFVGVVDGQRATVLVIHSLAGAAPVRVSALALSAAATAFAVGDFDGDAQTDLAIAAGNELLLASGVTTGARIGRGNNTVGTLTNGALGALAATGWQVSEFTKSRRHLYASPIQSLVAGDFDARQGSELAALTAEGVVHLVRANAGSETSSKQSASRKTNRKLESRVALAASTAERLFRVNVSASPQDDLLLLDGRQRNLRLVETSSIASGRTTAASSVALAQDFDAVPLLTQTAVLELERAPLAVLGLRLNPDALDDLVILKSGDLAPAVVETVPQAVFQVTTNNDNGMGSLREAIANANTSPGADSIVFNIPPGGAQVINLMSPLPPLVDPVTIDATTQPGFSGSPIIVLSGLMAGGSGLSIATTNCVVRGLVINNFMTMPGNGIEMGELGGGHIIEGNFIGTDITGSTAAANVGFGIEVGVIGGNRIGGVAAAARNLISGNESGGVLLIDSNNNQVQGNFIGTDFSGNSMIGNGGRGIAVISLLPTTAGNLIGGVGAGNRIAFNMQSGVAIELGPGNPAGARNSILANAIFQNGMLGIDLGNDGVTANDALDADNGANGLQNFPSVQLATTNGSSTTINGTLASAPSSSFRLEFFSNVNCDASGNGEGQLFLGSTNVATNVDGIAPFSVTFPFGVPVGQFITATATDAAGNTSEFSMCQMVEAAIADLSITKIASPEPVQSGFNLTYTITITNNGPHNADNITFTDTVPTGTTFVSLTGGSGCSTPPLGGTGTITCALGSLPPGAMRMLTLVVNVNAAPGDTVTNTATVNSATMDPTMTNNTATTMTAVIMPVCAINCPTDVVINGDAATCGTVVNYPAPIIAGMCGDVICTPPAGAFFPIGTTQVTCTTSLNPSCTFRVTVVDNTPPVISCPANLTLELPAGQTGVLVNYELPEATDNCLPPTVSCIPPSGSVFAAGVRPVNCAAVDQAGNAVTCAFTVSVRDGVLPVITCPQDVTVQTAAGQSAAVVTYPLPVVSDNLPDVRVSCVPASGASFPLGSTAVTCTATDAGGNQATCRFNVNVQGGAPLAVLVIPNNQPAVAFGTPNAPLPPRRKAKKNRNIPCASFSIENRGFTPLVITYQSVVRTGADVTGGRISNPGEGGLYSLHRINADGSETLLPPGSNLSLAVGARANFCLRFNPLIPAVVENQNALPATATLPDVITSRLNFAIAGGNPLLADVVASVRDELVFINPVNPASAPIFSFVRSGNEFILTYSVYDNNLDVRQASYELLDGGGRQVAQFDVDLEAALRQRNLLRGQSFTVVQRFTGAASNPQVSSLRLTVRDADTTITAAVALGSN